MSVAARSLVRLVLLAAPLVGGAHAAPPCLSGSHLVLPGPGDPNLASYVRVEGGAELQNPTAITLDLRFYADVPHNARILSKGDGINHYTDRAYDVTLLTDGRVQVDFFLFGPYFNENRVSLRTRTTIAPGTWYRVTATFDSTAGVARLYLGNQLEATATHDVLEAPLAGQLLRQSTYPLAIGCTPDLPWTTLQGGIDEVRIWTIALSTTQVLGTNPVPMHGLGGMAASFHLDGAAHDLSGGHAAAVVGAAGFAGGCAAVGGYGAPIVGSGTPQILFPQPPVIGTTPSIVIGNHLDAPTPLLLVVGAAPAFVPAFGGHLLAQPHLPVLLALGAADLTVPYTVPAADFTIHLQAFLPDPLAPKGVAASRGYYLHLGT